MNYILELKEKKLKIKIKQMQKFIFAKRNMGRWNEND